MSKDQEEEHRAQRVRKAIDTSFLIENPYFIRGCENGDGKRLTRNSLNVLKFQRENQVKEELVYYMKQGMSLDEAKQMVQRKVNAYNEEISPEDGPEETKCNLPTYFNLDSTLSVFFSETSLNFNNILLAVFCLIATPNVKQTDSNEFILDLAKVVRKSIGLPEEITEEPAEPEPKGKKARREFRKQQKLKRMAPPTSSEITGSLVQRNESRLTSVTAKHERITHGLQLDTNVKDPQQSLYFDEEGKGILYHTE